MDKSTDLSTNRCGLCENSLAKYACPKCNIQYCSVDCYRSEAHGQCSEDFYRDCVLSELGSQDADPQARTRMLEMLSRLHNSEFEGDGNELDSDDESDEEDLAERLQGIDLNDADSVWDKLTAKEKKEFEELLRSGDVSKILTTWEPWWCYSGPELASTSEQGRYAPKWPYGVGISKEKSSKVMQVLSSSSDHGVKKKVVQELDSTEEPDESYKKNFPAVDETIQPLSKLSRVTPSASVMWNLTNVLSSYVITIRVYNGEHESYIQEAANMLIALSANLSTNQNFEDFNMAVTAARQEAINAPWFTAEAVDELQLRQNLENICHGPSETKSSFYVLAALCDIHKLFYSSKSVRKGTKSKLSGEFSIRFPDAHLEDTIPKVTKDKLKSCIRKIEFYQSWAKEYM